MAIQDSARPAAGGRSGSAKRPVSRRGLLTGVAVGGAALIATNVTTGVAAHRVTSYLDDKRAAAELMATRSELEAEIRRLQMQLSLYRELERVGLDQVIRALVDVYDRLWVAARGAIRLLRSGVGAIDDVLKRFEAGLSALSGAALGFVDLLSGLENRVRIVQDVIAEVIKRAAPIGEAVSSFLAQLLSKIPFGIGISARVYEANDRLSELAAAVADFVAATRQRLLEPLQQVWLGTQDGKGIQGELFDPLRQKVLTPLNAFLDETERMANTWDEQTKLVRAAIEQRDKIRKEIARLEQEPHLASRG